MMTSKYFSARPFSFFSTPIDRAPPPAPEIRFLTIGQVPIPFYFHASPTYFFQVPDADGNRPSIRGLITKNPSFGGKPSELHGKTWRITSPPIRSLVRDEASQLGSDGPDLSIRIAEGGTVRPNSRLPANVHFQGGGAGASLRLERSLTDDTVGPPGSHGIRPIQLPIEYNKEKTTERRGAEHVDEG
ncbi:hypothetical protein BHE74_00012472 [Ensete ventricosum]|nr:hypothetical protein GW17_00029669 [Ensete ventricosum]RWW79258.1 hypothetical protein BHE74_00012472 [Ensete ventricosum]RZR92148.1 hypothetical protein BHM03_00020401 [Ensete ventricosum]